MSRPAADIIRTVLRTEKGTRILANRAYLFQVDHKATKQEIKQAVEVLFKVKVVKVNTSIMRGKPKRVRQQLGYRPDWKRAMVTLAEGAKIEVAI